MIALIAGMQDANLSLPPPPAPSAHGPQLRTSTCSEEKGEEIIICAPERDSRYRIAKPFRQRPVVNDKGDLSVIQERMSWVEGDPMDYMGYCTAVGPEGWQGCVFEAWKDRRQEKGLAY